MKYRCLTKSSHKYARYGGRGITVHPPWVESFELFYDYIGDPPSAKHSLDRIDNNGNYEPGNVRWATPHQQRVNQEGGTRDIIYEGKTYSLTDAAAKFGMTKHTLFKRLERGWDIEAALTRPVRTVKRSVTKATDL